MICWKQNRTNSNRCWETAHQLLRFVPFLLRAESTDSFNVTAGWIFDESLRLTNQRLACFFNGSVVSVRSRFEPFPLNEGLLVGLSSSADVWMSWLRFALQLDEMSARGLGAGSRDRPAATWLAASRPNEKLPREIHRWQHPTAAPLTNDLTNAQHGTGTRIWNG